MAFKLPETAARHISANTQKCLEFALQLDKLKGVKRRSPRLDLSRVENSAEHSWHAATLAMVLLADNAQGLDAGRIIRMLLVHDIVEIDAGDTFLYDSERASTQRSREEAAAARIFGLLPEGVDAALTALWHEFEEGLTAEAAFARGVDRLLPLLMNYFSDGGTWSHPMVNSADVLKRKAIISMISEDMWKFAEALIGLGIKAGHLAPAPQREPPRSPRLETVNALPDGSFRQSLTAYARWDDVPADILTIASQFEQRFHKPFDLFLHFPDEQSKLLHRPPDEGEADRANAAFSSSVASNYDDRVLGHIATMTEVANATPATQEGGDRFFDAVLDIYRCLRGGLRYLTLLDDTVVVAPQREGAQIAAALDCLPQGRSLLPNAKRMPFRDGLIVGLEAPHAAQAFARCVIVDGAIASASTLMALIEALRGHIAEFHVFSVHAPASALRALSRYAAEAGVRLVVNVGHVSGTLDYKRYTRHEDGTLVIGDLGDIFSLSSRVEGLL